MDGEKRARDEDEEGEEDGLHGDCLKKLCRGLGIVEEEDEEEDQRELLLQRQQQEEQEQGITPVDEVDSGFDREELLSGVIKSLEEEINLSSASSSPAAAAAPPPPQEPVFSRQYSTTSSAELSYLLEASDDELGISIASPALSEADLAGTCCGEDQLRANSILDLLEGEVISLASGDFPEFEEEWIRRTVATMDIVADSSSLAAPPPPPPPSMEDWNGSSVVAGMETTGHPVLIESRK